MVPVIVEILERGSGERSRHVFTRSPVRIGRSPLNNLVLEWPWISGLHAIIHFDDHQVHFCDLGSRNGTELKTAHGTSRMPPNEHVNLDERSEIHLGTILLTVRRMTLTEAAAVDSGAPLPPAAFSGAFPQMPHGGTPPGAPPPVSEAPAFQAGFTQYGSLGGVGSFPSGQPSPGADPASNPTGRESPGWDRPLSQPGNSLAPPANAVAFQAGGTRMIGRGEAHHLLDESLMQGPSSTTGAASSTGAAQPQGSTGSWGDRASQVEGPPASAGFPSSRQGAALMAALYAAWKPGGALPPMEPETQRFVEALLGTLDAFARGFVELRRGYQEFGRELGVRSIVGNSVLHRSENGSEILQYLLQGPNTGNRIDELVDLYADFMVHEISLLNGMKSGIRSLLEQLDPEGGYRQSESDKGSVLPRLFDKSLQRYTEFFRAIAEEHWQDTVFGNEFAHAYAEATGMQDTERKSRSGKR